MKRIALLPLLFAFIVTFVAPVGAAFASEGAAEEPNVITVDPSALQESGQASEPVEAAESEGSQEPVLLPAGDEQPERVSTAATHTEINKSITSQTELKELDPQPTSPVVVPPAETVPVSPLLITAFKATGAHMHAVQLYNNSSEMISLAGSSLLYVAGGEEYAIPFEDGWVLPRSYMVLSWQGESVYADMEFHFEQVGDGVLEFIRLERSGYQPLVVTVPAGYQGELLHRYKSPAGNYTTTTTFAPGAEVVSGGGLYVLPGAPDLSIREILVNPRSCLVGAETPDCYDYVKVRNDGTEPLDLGSYRMRSGFSNTNSTASNTIYFNDILLPGEIKTLTHDKDGKRVSFAANDGTVWLEDIYGYEAYNLEVPPYVGSNLSAQVGRSWALNGETGSWQWATPAPFKADNDFTALIDPGKGAGNVQAHQLVPCQAGQYRSEETNRCRSIVAASVLKPCREGQYRSEETNRCRSIASAAASVLKPCMDGQFRNPATNRCKSIASTEDIALADCGEGRERNPATNRCRNVVASVLGEVTPFPVEKVPQSTDSFAGWWALGVVATVGIGYGVWEWRYELAGLGGRAVQFLSRLK